MTRPSSENNPRFATIRQSLALASPTDRSLTLEYLLNEARGGKLASADNNVLRRVDAALQSMPERLGPTAEAIAHAERRRCQFLDTHQVEILPWGGMRAEPRGESVAEFLIESDHISRSIHQKPLLHRDEFKGWQEAGNPAVTGPLSRSLEVYPGEQTRTGGHNAVAFNVPMRDLITAQAAYLVATGESLFQDRRAVALDGVVDFLSFGLYLPNRR